MIGIIVRGGEMSRELLKRALDFMEVVGCSDDDIYQLCDEIQDELSKLDPEPLCYLSNMVGTDIFEQCEPEYSPFGKHWTKAIPVYLNQSTPTHQTHSGQS
jgi:hypothetical protein